MRLSKTTNTFWLLVIVIIMLKSLFFMYFNLFDLGAMFGGGSDADYYNDYAFGQYGWGATNAWPKILRSLNEVGLYNRDIVTLILFVNSFTLLPYIYYKLVKLQDNKINPVKAGSVLLIIYYPI